MTNKDKEFIAYFRSLPRTEQAQFIQLFEEIYDEGATRQCAAL